MRKIYLTVLIVFIAFNSKAQTMKILFDASKAEMAGNADWVIDADNFNLGPKSTGLMATGYGNEANPQRYPTPAQSGITSTTAQTYWKGGLSAWGVELAKLGYTIETLPYNGLITYNNTSNPQDLKNYKVFVMCEPNIRLTTAEKTALLNFVNAGGGLMMIADHDVSDRNNDGWDSPHILNDFMTNNGSVTNPFGIIFDYANFSQTTSNFNNALTTDPVLYGPKGHPTQMKFSNGTSMTLSTTTNSSVRGIVYKTGSTFGSSNAMVAHAHYGAGKVVGVGDSSPSDDGSGDTNDALYCGWSCEVNGDHARLLLNATIWLTTTTASPMKVQEIKSHTLDIYPNPTNEILNIRFPEQDERTHFLTITDLSGRTMYQELVQRASGENSTSLNIGSLSPGNYIICLQSEAGIYSERFVKLP